MNKKLVFSAILVLLLAFAAVYAFAQTSPGVRWEYHILDRDAYSQLYNLGREGWELVTVDRDGDYIFKRRLP